MVCLFNRSTVNGFFVAAMVFVPSLSQAEETVVRKAWLPFGLADVEQTLIFDPSEAEYNSARDDALTRLRAGESLNNPIDGPWVRIETTATVGFEIEGIGSSSGTTKYRQITAAEDALFQFENE